MQKLTEISLVDLKEIILNHKNELQERSGGTSMIELASRIYSESNGNPKTNIFQHFSALLRQLSFHIEDFTVEDLSSLHSFVEYSKIINDEIIWTYLNLIKPESDITRKTLILKLAYVFDKELMSEKILYLHKEIKGKFPLFWIDLLFYNNNLMAIDEMSEFIKNNKIQFTKLYPVINRWLKNISEENRCSNIIDKIIDLKKWLNKKDQFLYQRWLDENEIYTENYFKILNYSELVDKQTSHILNS